MNISNNLEQKPLWDEIKKARSKLIPNYRIGTGYLKI
jgi:hypothetical protein